MTSNLTSLGGAAGLCLLALLPASATAEDRNGYVAQYECRAGNPACNVDVTYLATRQCEQVITPQTTPLNDWSAIDWSKNVICLASGDYTNRGTLVLRSSGQSNSYKVIRHASADPVNEEPWKRSRRSARP